MTQQEPMVADALRESWVHRLLPQALWPYAQLARWERPIGWRLLMWPCWWSAALAVNAIRAAGSPPPVFPDPVHLVLFAIGAIAMRGAGCTYNDLVDVDIDRAVARTRSRPLPSGRVGTRGAALFLLVQLVVSLLVLLQFNKFTIGIGVLSLVTVAVYPFMKRITWWPQLFLGLAFSWGALMGWAATFGTLSVPPLLLYAACIFWVIGYDTIYALQDVEDDALVGVRSTARLFGPRVRSAIALLYAVSLVLFALSFLSAGAGWPAWLALALGAGHLGWQAATLRPDDPRRCLMLFRANSHFGWILFLGLVIAAIV